MRWNATRAAALGLLATSTVASAEMPTAAAALQPADAPTVLETVVVSGVLPGPGLWRVEHEGHRLWILGTVSPLPAAMDWQTTEVETILAGADALIAPGGADADIGAGDVFTMALLARSARAAIRNPDRDKLDDVLPAELYARWAPLKAKYLADDDAVERNRPMFASQDLYYSAIELSGLTRVDVAWNRVRELADASGVPVIDTRVRFPLAIDRGAYRDGIRALSESRVDDLTCFTTTLDNLQADLERMKAGANAWAIGDLQDLREMGYEEVQPPCRPVYDAAMGFQQRNVPRQQAADAWLAAAESALRTQDETLAVLPMQEIVAVDGLVARLRERGFAVVAPDDDVAR